MVRAMTKSETRSVEALLADGGVVDHAGLFAGLWGVIGELRELIDRRFVLRAELEPSLAGYANADDSCRGELRAYRGPGVERLVQAWLGAPERGFMNLHLNVWLGPETLVPHLAVVLATVPDLFVYLDCPARVDVASEPEYVDRYYTEGNARLLELSADPVGRAAIDEIVHVFRLTRSVWRVRASKRAWSGTTGFFRGTRSYPPTQHHQCAGARRSWEDPRVSADD